jgi:hypothetical protein
MARLLLREMNKVIVSFDESVRVATQTWLSSVNVNVSSAERWKLRNER